MLPIQESMSANARAVAMAERLGDKLRVVRNGAGHASRLALVGQITPALDLLEDHWQRAHRLNDLWTASQVMLGVQAILHRELSDPAEMLRWIERELAAGRLNRARNHFIFWRAVEALQWLELGEIGRASRILVGRRPRLLVRLLPGAAAVPPRRLAGSDSARGARARGFSRARRSLELDVSCADAGDHEPHPG
jgi:hypothetical protein